MYPNAIGGWMMVTVMVMMKVRRLWLDVHNTKG